MNGDQFWAIIRQFDWDRVGDDEAVLEPAIKTLAAQPAAEIAAFEELMSQKLYALDTMAHARHIGEDSYVGKEEYFSVDAFLYARCCVVANGKQLFELVLSEPAEFPEDMEFEALLNLASAAHKRKTGVDPGGFSTSVSYETFSNQAGWNAA